MKGPSERLKYDMRRIWECPICHHREGTGGHVTSRLCNCQAQAPALACQFMRLVSDGARRVIEPKTPAPTDPIVAIAAATEVVVPLETTVIVHSAGETPAAETTATV